MVVGTKSLHLDHFLQEGLHFEAFVLAGISASGKSGEFLHEDGIEIAEILIQHLAIRHARNCDGSAIHDTLEDFRTMYSLINYRPMVQDTIQ